MNKHTIEDLDPQVRKVINCLDILSFRETLVLLEVYKLGMTMEEVGHSQDRTKERVRQQLDRAVKKIYGTMYAPL